MPSNIQVIAEWTGLGLISLIFYANALGIVDQERTRHELVDAGSSARLAGIAVAAGRLVQLVAATGLFFSPTRIFAAMAMAGFLALATLTAHAFWRAAPEARDAQLANFLKNVAMIGGLILAAACGGTHE